MTLNTRIHVQYEITERSELLSLSNSIRENIRSHDKEENEKRNVTNYRDTTSNERECTKESRIRISKRIMNIPGRQE